MSAMRTMIRRAGCTGLLLLGAATAAAQSADGGYRSFRPEGPGPHPAVVFVSGCSGFSPSFAPGAYERIAEQLRSQGYMVIFADYLGRRNLKSCAGGAISHADAAKELVAAAAWLKSLPTIDSKRITALGWSYGGGAVLVALDRYPDEERGFSRAVVYYPDCRSVRPWKATTPVLMLHRRNTSWSSISRPPGSSGSRSRSQCSYRRPRSSSEDGPMKDPAQITKRRA